MYMPCHAYGSQKTACGNRYSPSIILVLGIKLRSSGLIASTFLYMLSHLNPTGFFFLYDKIYYHNHFSFSKCFKIHSLRVLYSMFWLYLAQYPKSSLIDLPLPCLVLSFYFLNLSKPSLVALKHSHFNANYHLFIYKTISSWKNYFLKYKKTQKLRRHRYSFM